MRLVSLLSSRSKHSIWIINFIHLLQIFVLCLKRISSYHFYVVLQHLLIKSRISLMLIPFNLKSHDSRILSHYPSYDAIKIWLRRNLHSIVFILIHDVVAHSKELLSLIRHWYYYCSCPDNILLQNFRKIRWVRVSIEGHYSWLYIIHIELINDLIIGRISGWAEVDELPVEGAWKIDETFEGDFELEGTEDRGRVIVDEDVVYVNLGHIDIKLYYLRAIRITFNRCLLLKFIMKSN